MPIRSHTRRVRISSAVAGVLVVTCAWLGSATAAEPVSLRITTPEGEETRALAAGTVVTSVMQGDGGTTASAKTFTRPASGEERVIIELVGTPLVHRAGARGRASRADRDAVAAQHQRVRDEIARLTGRPAARAAGGAVTQEFSLVFNGVAAALTRSAQTVLRAHLDVKAIHPDTQVEAVLDTSVPFVGAPTFWSQHGNYRGAGQVIAIIDTGIDYGHADLGACGAIGGACKVSGGYDFHNGDGDPRDDHGHGTHVAAIAAGNGALLGVAPDATLLAYKVLGANGLGFTSNVIAAIEASVDPNGDLDTSDHADVVNLSLGGPGDPDDPGSQAVDAATAAGVLVVAGAGNNGAYLDVVSPGTARTALTVGAVDETPARAGFTSGGPTTGTFELKPEISAPGVTICAARAQSTSLGPTCMDATHVTVSGTSMATPHVAGAAALLRGIFPALSPGDVKSLLVQNSSTALSDDELKIGTGILDVPAAADAHTVVSPQALTFGVDDVTQAVWVATRTLTIRNLDVASRSYNLSATGAYWGLPAGATVAFAPASFTLAAGQATTVDVQLTVNNGIVPDQATSPNAYDALIALDSGSEIQRVPMIFLKTSLLRIHTDQLASLVLVHDRTFTYRSRVAQPAGLITDVLVPAGTWDVIVVFPNGLGAYVVHEGIVVSGLHDEYVNATEAVHTVSLTGTTELGAPVTQYARSYALMHRASGIGISSVTNDVAPPFAITTNTLSASYDVDLATMSVPATKTYLITRSVTGISSSHALGNTPAELTHGSVVYYPNPGEVGLQRSEWFVYLVSSLNGLSVGTGNASLAPNHDLYVTTAPHARTRSFVRTEVTSTTDLHSGPLHHGGASTGVIDAFNFFDVDNTVTSTTTGELPLNLGPAAFFAKFDNIHVWVSVQWVAGHGFWLFHDQGGDGPDAPTDDVVWRLFSGTNEVVHGTAPQRSTLGGPIIPFINGLTPGSYRFETDPLPYWVAGLPATSRIVASFDTSLFPANNVDPPYLKSVTVRSGGVLTDTVTCGDTATVRIEAHDEVDETDMTLSLFRVQGMSLTPVPLTALGGGQFEAAMADACDGAGAVDLLIVATDPIGNELRQELTPAFGCRPSTCGNGVTEAGEVCDDGNLVSNDGCDSLCSSTENCGDGVQTGGETCDDGNTTGGDGCSATCQVEATPTPTATPTVTATPVPPTPTTTGTPLCAPVPDTCRTPVVSAKAMVSIINKSRDDKDQLQWKWSAGAATTKAEFGDPLNTDDYVLCLYDGTGYLTSLSAPAGGLCRGRACWADKPKGFKYKDKDADPSGLTQLQLTQGTTGKAKIQVKGKGVLLPDLTLSSLVSPLTVQLKRSGGGVCFGATYSFPPAIKNDGVTFKDKAN